MASSIWKLRFALLLSFQRASISKLLRSALFAVGLVVTTVSIALVPLWLSDDNAVIAGWDTIMVSLVTILSCLIAFFRSEKLLSIRNFLSMSFNARSLRFALLSSTVLTWPTLLLLLWVLVMTITRGNDGVLLVSSLITTVFILATTFLVVRIAAEVGVLVSDFSNSGVMRSSGQLLLLAGVPLLLLFAIQLFQETGTSAVVETAKNFAWTPFGAAISGHAQIIQGEIVAGAWFYLLSAGYVVALYAIWALSAQRVEQSMPKSRSFSDGKRSVGIFTRFPVKPWGVVAARSLTYWLRDPRYRISLLALPVAPLLITATLWVAGVDYTLLILIPLPVMLLLLGWSIHNDVAADSTAFWMHVASGTSGGSDRIGRLAPVFVVGIPLAVIGSSLSVVLLADWRVFPAVFGTNISVLCVAAGISCLSSVMTPYPFTRPGDSPFSQPANSSEGISAGLAQSISMVAILMLLLPVGFIAYSAVTEPSLLNNLSALLFCLVYGGLIIFLGVHFGGKSFDRRAPELLSAAQNFD